MSPGGDTFFGEEEEAEEGGFEEEGEDAFHSEGLADDSPVTRAKEDQLVPNWNSMGMPVTTPMTKLTAKILPQKRAAS